MKKHLLLSLLLTGALWSETTDILTPKMYSEDIFAMQTKDFICNYWIETSGQSLELIASAKNKQEVLSNYNKFIITSDRAIEICRDIDEDVSFQMEEIKSDIAIFMKEQHNVN